MNIIKPMKRQLDQKRAFPFHGPIEKVQSRLLSLFTVLVILGCSGSNGSEKMVSGSEEKSDKEQNEGKKEKEQKGSEQETKKDEDDSDKGVRNLVEPAEKILNSPGLPLEDIELPDGFEIEVFYGKVPNARSMEWGDEGTLFVGTRDEGKVYALVDEDGDRYPEKKHIVAEGMNMPNGVAFRHGDLYVAEISRILRYENIEAALPDIPEPTVVKDDYPTDRHHGWKYIEFGPDGKLYVPVGAPCNICKREDPIYGTITRMEPDGSDREIVARGVRNSVGITWHPETEVLWFTDNGGDNLGDNMPADELNRAPEQGLHFGYPYCHQGDFPDPEYGKERDCEEFTPPARKLGPHVASLGLLFYTDQMFPEKHQGDIFIAEHGSWNRSTPIGYRVTRVPVEDGEAKGYEVFAKGWLQDDGSSWGRPVDVLLMKDGSMLLSDDRAGVIYRIWYKGE